VLKRQPNESEGDLLSVAEQSIEVSSKILQALNEFDLGGKHSKIEAIRSRPWNKEKLESLNRRLAELQRQLMSVVLLGLR
jgi:hypothetical protein